MIENINESTRLRFDLDRPNSLAYPRCLKRAQFEREFTDERIRDKIAVSKHKGMMGGVPPLGYDASTAAHM